MTIRIESLTVENLRRFRGKHQLDLGQNAEGSIDIITGSKCVGKTMLAHSIQLCLTGEFEQESPLALFDAVNQLSPGEKVPANVSTIISDSDLGRRFRFQRQFQTSETRRGPVNLVNSLQVQEEEDGEWVDVGSGEAVNTVFPLPSFTFCKLDTETSLGFDNTKGGISWSKLVEDVGDAAAQQAAARDVDLPGYFSNDYDLGDEMLRRINDLLESINGRYRVEERQDSLVGRMTDLESGRRIQNPSAGYEVLISQAVALVAGDIMPASPPLIGDTIFAQISLELREKIFNVVKQKDRQFLLFAMDLELEGLDITPRFKVKPTQEGMIRNITKLR